MITEKQIEIGHALLATGLVNSVYHSVELVEDKNGVRFPAYKIGAEQFYIGPDDTMKMFAYIRSFGQAVRQEEIKDGSCSKLYKMSAPHRVVIFQDHATGNFDAMINKLLSLSFIKDISLVAYSNNAFQLGKQESPIGDFAFDATTFYLAIDVQIKFLIFSDKCDEDPCINYPNPICQS
jgi:hypothetical protein